MKQAWFGFLVLISALLFIWLATEQLAPVDPQLLTQQAASGAERVVYIPAGLLLIATAILPLVWVMHRLVELHNLYFVRRLPDDAGSSRILA